MVVMPTIEVTEEQADRILAAYMAKYNTTTVEETIQAYQNELIYFIVTAVMDHETNVILKREEESRNAALKALRDSLPTIPGLTAPEPPAEPPPPAPVQ